MVISFKKFRDGFYSSFCRQVFLAMNIDAGYTPDHGVQGTVKGNPEGLFVTLFKYTDGEVDLTVTDGSGDYEKSVEYPPNTVLFEKDLVEKALSMTNEMLRGVKTRKRPSPEEDLLEMAEVVSQVLCK